MNIKVLKKENGISLQDIVIAMVILSMFVGVIGSMYYEIAFNSNLIKLNAIAVEYAIKVAEDVDILSYEDINENFDIYMNSKHKMPEGFNLTVSVKKYNEQDSSKQDIIKIVTINVEYTIFDKTNSYEIKKLKVKEY